MYHARSCSETNLLTTDTVVLNFKPSKTITATKLQAIKNKNRTMIGRGVLFTEETLTVAIVCLVPHSRLLPV